MFKITHYLSLDRRDIYQEWRLKLRDFKAALAVDRRLHRVEDGNFGDHKFCRDGVWELRIDVGAGYRVYYAIEKSTVVLLLCGGNKRSQSADIDRACAYWHDGQRRKSE